MIIATFLVVVVLVFAATQAARLVRNLLTARPAVQSMETQ